MLGWLLLFALFGYLFARRSRSLPSGSGLSVWWSSVPRNGRVLVVVVAVLFVASKFSRALQLAVTVAVLGLIVALIFGVGAEIFGKLNNFLSPSSEDESKPLTNDIRPERPKAPPTSPSVRDPKPPTPRAVAEPSSRARPRKPISTAPSRPPEPPKRDRDVLEQKFPLTSPQLGSVTEWVLSPSVTAWLGLIQSEAAAGSVVNCFCMGLTDWALSGREALGRAYTPPRELVLRGAEWLETGNRSEWTREAANERFIRYMGMQTMSDKPSGGRAKLIDDFDAFFLAGSSDVWIGDLDRLLKRLVSAPAALRSETFVEVVDRRNPSAETDRSPQLTEVIAIALAFAHARWQIEREVDLERAAQVRYGEIPHIERALVDALAALDEVGEGVPRELRPFLEGPPRAFDADQEKLAIATRRRLSELR